MPRVTIRVNATEAEGVPSELVERASRKASDICQEQESDGPILVVYRGKCAANLYYDACHPPKGQPKS